MKPPDVDCIRRSTFNVYIIYFWVTNLNFINLLSIFYSSSSIWVVYDVATVAVLVAVVADVIGVIYYWDCCYCYYCCYCCYCFYCCYCCYFYSSFYVTIYYISFNVFCWLFSLFPDITNMNKTRTISENKVNNIIIKDYMIYI